MRLAEWSCYATALPQLDAAQTLHRAQAAALPWLPPQERRRTLSRLQQTLDLPDSTAAVEVPGLPIHYVSARDPVGEGLATPVGQGDSRAASPRSK